MNARKEQYANEPVFGITLNTKETNAANARMFSSFDRGEIADWHAEPQEGQLAVDVAQVGDKIIVVSTLAGVFLDSVEVYVHNDLLTIRGTRTSPLTKYNGVEYFLEECFWGKFSRTIVLPVDVKGDLAQASYTGGILTVTIPLRHSERRVPITIVEE